MGRSTILANRLVTLLVGAALLAGGGYGVALWAGLDLAHSLARRMDRLWYFNAAQQGWWQWALLGAAALSLLVGLALLVAVARPRAHRTADLAERSLGLLSVDPSAVADAVAASLEGLDGVLKAQASARRIAGTPTISITLTVDPRTEIPPLRALLESTAAQTTASFGPNSPAMRYFLRVDSL